MPGRLQIGGGQIALDRAMSNGASRRNWHGFGGDVLGSGIGRRGFLGELGADELIDGARARFRLMTDRDGDLAADDAGIRLALASRERRTSQRLPA